MNERINELYTKVVGDDRLNFDSYLAEKFAELIVRECAKLVEDNLDSQNAWITPGFIKEHFGVE